VTDQKSPLYDPRVHLPVDEAMVLNIMHMGVTQSIVINKNAETGAVEVVAGRQRVKAAREANKRLIAKGCMPIQVPAVVRRASGIDNAGVMVSENELRQSDTPVWRAEKMARLLGYGKTEQELSVIFGCTLATVRNSLALLDSPKIVREAVESGKVGVGHALALSALAPDEQRAKLAQLIDVANTSNGHDRAKKQRAIVKPGPRVRSKREIQTERDRSKGERRAALDWVLGK
jgi:ParB family chromosome partitioning protein